MDPPNSLPSAREVALRCFCKYRFSLDADCVPAGGRISLAPLGISRVVATS